MFKRKICGQEATEFVLISILVFFSALMVVLLFGGKIANFFNKESSVAKTSGFTTQKINPANNQKYVNNIDSYVGPVKSKTGSSSDPSPITISYDDNNSPSMGTFMAGDISAIQHEDGTVSFKAGNQTVTMPADVVEKAGQVFQTTGSSGTSELIKELAAIIDSFKKDYPDGQVPINIVFGDSTSTDDYDITYGRIQTSESEQVLKNTIKASFQGEASTSSSVTIKVGNHVVILQKDHVCTSGSTCSMVTPQQRRIEGEITSDNTFEGKLLAYDSTQGKYVEKVPRYDANISVGSNGLLQSFNHTAPSKTNSAYTYSDPGSVSIRAFLSSDYYSYLNNSLSMNFK